MKRIPLIAGAVALGAGLLWRVPLFHVVSLEQAAALQQASAFNAREFAENYWQTRLTPHLANADDAPSVLAAIQTDALQARAKFGRTVGLGRSCYFFLRGEATIVSIEKNTIGVALSEDGHEPDLLIAIGPVFGNAVRDAPGLLTGSDFPYSRHFNEVAAELNLLVENRVGRPLAKQAEIRRRLHFVGCMEMLGDRAAKPLKLIPLQAVVE